MDFFRLTPKIIFTILELEFFIISFATLVEPVKLIILILLFDTNNLPILLPLPCTKLINCFGADVLLIISAIIEALADAYSLGFKIIGQPAAIIKGNLSQDTING